MEYSSNQIEFAYFAIAFTYICESHKNQSENSQPMREKDSRAVQHSFLSLLKDALPSDGSLAFELSESLGISMDSAYRRIRGETPLSLEEAYTLSKLYNVSFEGLQSDAAGVVHFAYTPLTPDVSSMMEYLTKLRDNLKMIASMDHKYISYCSQDIPIFHNVRGGKVSQFKLFYWMRSVLNIDELLSTKFSEDCISTEMMDVCTEIYDLYASIPSSELWSTSTINSTLRQIQYYWESGIFVSAQDALDVTADLKILIEQVEKQAALGLKSNEKGDGAEYHVYVSEIELTTNCALAEMNQNKAVFLGHLTFNMLESVQASYCTQTTNWFKNMISKATLISNVGEKYRFQFFQDAHRKIADLEKMISA